MKSVKLFSYTIGLFMITFLLIGCPSECENDDGDCYTPYGPCDEEPENSTSEIQNQEEDQKTVTINAIENENKNNESTK